MNQIQWIFSGIGVFALSLIIAFFAKRRAAKNLPTTAPPASPKYPRDAKTVRRVSRVELGSFSDFDFSMYEVGVHLVDIRMSKKKYSSVEEPFALVKIRHHRMFPTSNVEVVEDGFQFLMPKGILEEHDSVYAFSVKGEFYWYFVRPMITHINHHSGWADFEFSAFSARG
jgi:hypothetical protein